jgi:predicted amidohydrolase
MLDAHRSMTMRGCAMNLRLAAIQLDTIPGEVNYNVHKAMTWTKRAFDRGANYVFLHEGLTADYTPAPLTFGRAIDSPEVTGFATLAERYDGYVALGLNEAREDKAYITTVFLGKDGVLGAYRKSYLWPNPSQCPDGDFQKFLQTYDAPREGYRLERGILGHGDGTVVLDIGPLRIGCIICADGWRTQAWQTFERDKPDLIFWQNNRCNVVADGRPQTHARQLDTAMVCTNRVGFSHAHFQEGGTCIVTRHGDVAVRANERGEEEIIFANYGDL